MDQDLIDRYAAGPATLRGAVAGLGHDNLTAFPIPGTWSILQIVAHLLDSDLIAVHRMKRIIAEENPLLIGYDESAFARALSYHGEPPGELLDAFALNRAQMARILRALPAEAAGRRGVHNERGVVRLGELVGDYIEHLEHHLRFVRRKRELLGKPLGP